MLLLEAGYVTTTDGEPTVPQWQSSDTLPMRDETREALNSSLKSVLEDLPSYLHWCAYELGLATAHEVLRRAYPDSEQSPFPECKFFYDTRYFYFARIGDKIHFYVRTNTDDLILEQRNSLESVDSSTVPDYGFGPTGADFPIPTEPFIVDKDHVEQPARSILFGF
ncbi:hypothetical protein IWQ60_009838 [Tieghemiomyces parasiticus]|uniref:Uncharacterized protein n=1 Tax=Tieghemiomyces parasiticus TaxID=78921 RepID=A0A9W7ZUV7_9FUNG|nr:hypothetical protein IWQ60_009838 [Tieghemiomyces parasiticus]